MTRSLIAAALAIATIAAPAAAATDTFNMDVKFSRANLDTAKGAAAEYAHIRDQVVDRCEAEHEGFGFAEKFAVEFCTEQTLGKAIRKINNPNLTAVHAKSR